MHFTPTEVPMLPRTPLEFMNAKATKKDIDQVAGPHMVAQPKLDGWRLAFYVDADRVRSFTRTLKPQTGKTPALDAEFAERFPAGTIIDGEIVAMKVDEQGRAVNDFKWVAEVMGSGEQKARDRQQVAGRPMQFVAFDVLMYAGTDVRHLPYSERLALLTQHFEDEMREAALISMVLNLPVTQATHDALVAAGMEGTVVKDLRSPYRSGERTSEWLKFKNTPSADVIVMGFEEGKGKYADTIGAVIFGQYKDGELVERGRCSGMDDAMRRDMGLRRETYVGQVMEVTFMGFTSGDCFRHPQFSTMRPEKPALECGWDVA